jgi:hypothetical protein
VLKIRKSASRNRSRNIALVLATGGVGLLGIGFASPSQLGAGATSASGKITGTIFRDYDGSGTKAATEPGQDGIEVRAFDANGAPTGASATSAPDGSYTVTTTVGAGTPVRVEFTIPAAYGFLRSGPAAAAATGAISSQTSVQFTTVGQTANFGVWNPSEYCQANPTLVLGCQTFGDPIKGSTAALPALKTFPANATGSPWDKTASVVPATLAQNKSLGTTFGLAYSRTTTDTYASAFQKMYAGYGSGGPGAIYKVTAAGATTLLATIPNAGTDVRAGFAPNVVASNSPDWLNDPTWDKVGKMSLGGLALTDDDATAWVVNLNDRSLYAVTVATGVVSAPVAIPLAAGAKTACDAIDVRPFALTGHDGKMYVGETCTAQSTKSATGMAYYVYAFDPIAKTFGSAPVFETPINATEHGRPGNGCGPNAGAGAWYPWTATDLFNSTTAHQCAYSQPWLTGIAFDNGNLVLGVRDRFGDQAGEDHPVGGEGVAAGDLLRACGTLATGWTLEVNGTCGGGSGSGVGNKQGPGGGEFYGFEHFEKGLNHQDTSVGSVLQLAGQPSIIYTVFDPSLTNANDWRSAGIHTDSNTNGANVGWFQISDKCDSSPSYCTATPTSTGGANFGKANSLGEVEAFCDKAPIEIGDRVWFDANGNGVQDAGEDGIAGVTLSLRLGNAGNALATTKTDAKGNYVFNGANVTGGLKTATAYSIKLDKPADTAAKGPLTGLGLTVASAGDNRSIDSNAVLVAEVPTITVTTGTAGANDHTLDVGFRPTYALGNRVFRDLDNSGTLTSADGPKPGIGGVSVSLYRFGEAKPFTSTSTDPNGYYCFPSLPTGQYVAEVGAANFTGPLAGLTSSTGSGQEADPNADIDSNDNGLDGAGPTRSGVVALGPTEPTGEVDGATSCAGVADDHANLTVDFGFYGAAALGNYVWIDTNHDGLQNEPAGNGVNDVTVTVTDASGKVVGTAVTAENPDGGAPGYYHVGNLAPGTYTVTFTTLPAGFAPTATAAGADRGLDSDGLTSAPVTLKTGDDNLSIDLGLFAPTAVGDFTWVDANANGTFEENEAPLPGVKVTLLDQDGQPVTTDADGGAIISKVTGADGRYLFANLRPGVYQVQFVAPAGYDLTKAQQGSDPTIDSDGPIAISANLGAGEQDLTLDAGFVPQLASVGDRVWFDTNQDGVQDAGEKGVAGVTVRLINAAGVQIASTVTDAAGNYRFTGLTPGTYAVQFVPNTGTAFTKTGTGTVETDSNADRKTGRTATINLTGGQFDPTWDAGLIFASTVVNQTLPKTGSNPYRLLEAGGLLAELGAIALLIDAHRKRARLA